MGVGSAPALPTLLSCGAEGQGQKQVVGWSDGKGSWKVRGEDASRAVC
jgi:hypothetical protein